MACRSWRGLSVGVRYRRVLNVWQGAYPEVKSHSVSIGCLHCVDPECAAVCPVEAIYKRVADGVVWVDDEICIGCQNCLSACPYGVPQFGVEGTMQKCDLCIAQPGSEYGPPCVATCPGGALSLKTLTTAEKEAHQKTIASLMP
ncbi:4Fe-4S dicluster domain-containing protein [Desulfosarcina cetonica]|uniref:4Fe-4S dicluster domain-containing protein n=1 Tax=Desulfosarcina cetonica TaxID=90730 RepID=UPI0006D1B3E8|nr:4Fe-4S dicluster domain-containing protein [Desulfosarcina cetonica]